MSPTILYKHNPEFVEYFFNKIPLRPMLPNLYGLLKIEPRITGYGIGDDMGYELNILHIFP